MKFSQTILILTILILFVLYTFAYSRWHDNRNNKPAYVYTLNLKGGNKYVGYTQNPNKRINDHFNGYGAKWTKKHKPTSVESIRRYDSVSDAKRAETSTYYKVKNKYGKNKVRGAGNTKSY